MNTSRWKSIFKINKVERVPEDGERLPISIGMSGKTVTDYITAMNSFINVVKLRFERMGIGHLLDFIANKVDFESPYLYDIKPLLVVVPSDNELSAGVKDSDFAKNHDILVKKTEAIWEKFGSHIRDKIPEALINMTVVGDPTLIQLLGFKGRSMHTLIPSHDVRLRDKLFYMPMITTEEGSLTTFEIEYEEPEVKQQTVDRGGFVKEELGIELAHRVVSKLPMLAVVDFKPKEA